MIVWYRWCIKILKFTSTLWWFLKIPPIEICIYDDDSSSMMSKCKADQKWPLKTITLWWFLKNPVTQMIFTLDLKDHIYPVMISLEPCDTDDVYVRFKVHTHSVMILWYRWWRSKGKKWPLTSQRQTSFLFFTRPAARRWSENKNFRIISFTPLISYIGNEVKLAKKTTTFASYVLFTPSLILLHSFTAYQYWGGWVEGSWSPNSTYLHLDF